MDAFFLEVLECNHVPNPQAVANVAELLSDVTMEQINVLVQHLPPAIGSFLLALTLEAVENLDTTAREAIDTIARAADEALHLAGQYTAIIEELKEQAELAALEFAGKLEQIRLLFSDASTRNDILDDIHDFGVSKVVETVAASSTSRSLAWNRLPSRVVLMCWNAVLSTLRVNRCAVMSALLSIPMHQFSTLFAFSLKTPSLMFQESMTIQKPPRNMYLSSMKTTPPCSLKGGTSKMQPATGLPCRKEHYYPEDCNRDQCTF